MTKYLVDNEQVSSQEFYELLEDDVRNNVEDHYDELLDEIYPVVVIGYCTFDASRILKELDPIAYNCGIDDFVDGDLSNCNYELERGDVVELDHTFEIVEEDEEN